MLTAARIVPSASKINRTRTLSVLGSAYNLSPRFSSLRRADFLLSGGVALGGALMVALLINSKRERTVPRRQPAGVATDDEFKQTDHETI